jgi:hypothetical protein
LPPGPARTPPDGNLSRHQSSDQVSIPASLARYPGYLRRLLLHDSGFVLLGLAVLILVAGLLLGVTAVFTWQQLAISREGQITERFTRPVELSPPTSASTRRTVRPPAGHRADRPGHRGRRHRRPPGGAGGPGGLRAALPRPGESPEVRVRHLPGPPGPRPASRDALRRPPLRALAAGHRPPRSTARALGSTAPTSTTACYRRGSLRPAGAAARRAAGWS